jgi:hypothetical protein
MNSLDKFRSPPTRKYNPIIRIPKKSFGRSLNYKPFRRSNLYNTSKDNLKNYINRSKNRVDSILEISKKYPSVYLPRKDLKECSKYIKYYNSNIRNKYNKLSNNEKMVVCQNKNNKLIPISDNDWKNMIENRSMNKYEELEPKCDIFMRSKNRSIYKQYKDLQKTNKEQSMNVCENTAKSQK